MRSEDRVIRWSTALAVLGVAAVAAVASYEHAYEFLRAHGESGWTTTDGKTRTAIIAAIDGAGVCGATRPASSMASTTPSVLRRMPARGVRCRPQWCR